MFVPSQPHFLPIYSVITEFFDLYANTIGAGGKKIGARHAASEKINNKK